MKKMFKVQKPIKGWCAEKQTYNGVYAKKIGDDIYVNTGITAISPADKKFQLKYFVDADPKIIGKETIQNLKKKQKEFENAGYKTIIETEDGKKYGLKNKVKRLMIYKITLKK